MEWLKQNRTKSQLGQLLLKKKLISEDQLSKAIEVQKTSGQLLGDIFMQLGMVSQRQVQGMLRRQRHIRRIATIVTALLAPVQIYAADVTPVPVKQTQAANESKKQDGLRLLNEEELSEVAGQGLLDDALREWLNLDGSVYSNAELRNLPTASANMLSKPVSGLQVAGALLTLMDPLLGLLNAQITVMNVTYNPDHSKSAVNSDGSVTLSLPSSIGELSFRNIRVLGSTGPNFGSIDIRGVNLAGTVVTLKAH